jgi:hypothetical protein
MLGVGEHCSGTGGCNDVAFERSGFVSCLCHVAREYRIGDGDGMTNWRGGSSGTGTSLLKSHQRPPVVSAERGVVGRAIASLVSLVY